MAILTTKNKNTKKDTKANKPVVKKKVPINRGKISTNEIIEVYEDLTYVNVNDYLHCCALKEIDGIQSTFEGIIRNTRLNKLKISNKDKNSLIEFLFLLSIIESAAYASEILSHCQDFGSSNYLEYKNVLLDFSKAVNQLTVEDFNCGCLILTVNEKASEDLIIILDKIYNSASEVLNPNSNNMVTVYLVSCERLIERFTECFTEICKFTDINGK